MGGRGRAETKSKRTLPLGQTEPRNRPQVLLWINSDLTLTIDRLLLLPEEAWKGGEASLYNTSLSGKNVDRRSYPECQGRK